MSKRDLLVEIGTEELPPKALLGLITAFADAMQAALDDARLDHGTVRPFASPRRLALTIEALADGQPDRSVVQKGPPVSIAFDADGNPQPPATAFAKKCGVAVDALGRETTDKGEWLSFESVEQGRPTAELAPGLVEKALADLPIPKPMRWGAGDAEFVRPVHWIVLLHGSDVIDGTVLGVSAGRETRGHRFLGKSRITLDSAADYAASLEKDGRVLVDLSMRREQVKGGVEDAAAAAGGHVVDGESLYDEVSALVEWPVPLLGKFDKEFLELPREVVISTLTGHQRYFPVADEDGRLKPAFITVANLDSLDPDVVRDGNERVIRPRLADAAFFWDSDRKRSLASRLDQLKDVVYQRGLGSLYDKSARTASIALAIAGQLGTGAEAERAAMLAKCDLVTGMVGEFPELQGTMGSYYARADDEPDAVATAIGDHYRPRFAGDELPSTVEGQVLALADKLDTLAGVFALGKKPSGNRDPFGLRRAALGIIRILVECGLDVDLKALLRLAAQEQPVDGLDTDGVSRELYAFVSERMKHYFLDRDPTLDTETFEAVMARAPASLVDFEQRLGAVQAFIELDEAESLAAANKRIANILRKAGVDTPEPIEAKLLDEDAERRLHDALADVSGTVRLMLDEREYTSALKTLAGLREPVDTFFDDVMVMVDDDAVRANRLALLGQLRALFLDVADISRLSIA